jgi:hypothetical protein
MEEVEGSSGAHRIITSRSEFLQALREGFALAAAQGCRELLLSDPDFADWPLGELEVLDHLTRWAFAHRKLTLLGGHFDEGRGAMRASRPGGGSGRTSSNAARPTATTSATCRPCCWRRGCSR